MGSAGAGKTTLAQHLSAYFGIPLIEEGVREWLADRKLNDPKNLAWELQLEMQRDYLAKKMQNEHAHSEFISDRTSLDVITTLLLRTTSDQNTIPSELQLQALQHASETYQQIVLMHWNGLPKSMPDGVREINPELLHREYSLAAEFCKLIGVRTIHIIAHPTRPDIEHLVTELEKD